MNEDEDEFQFQFREKFLPATTEVVIDDSELPSNLTHNNNPINQENNNHNNNTNNFHRILPTNELAEQTLNQKKAQFSTLLPFNATQENQQSPPSRILGRFLEILSGLNLGCFCFLYCISLTKPTSSTAFQGILSYTIATILNISLGTSRYVVYTPSFLGLLLLHYYQSSGTYPLVNPSTTTSTTTEIPSQSSTQIQQWNIISALSGFCILGLSRVVGIEKLVFFVPATALLGFTYSNILLFIISRAEFSLNYFSESALYLDKVYEVLTNLLSGSSLICLAISAALISLYLLLQIRIPKAPGLICLVILSSVISNLVESLKDSQFSAPSLWLGFTSSLVSPYKMWENLSVLNCLEAAKLSGIVYLESLLTLAFSEKECADTMLNSSQEISVLALANILSGIFCGIPISASIFPTTLNGSLLRKEIHPIYPRAISMIAAVLALVLMNPFAFVVPYIMLATVLLGAAFYTLHLNLSFHASVTSKNFQVITLCCIGCLTNPIISAILGTAFSLLHTEKQRRSILFNSASPFPNSIGVNNNNNNNNNNHAVQLFKLNESEIELTTFQNYHNNNNNTNFFADKSPTGHANHRRLSEDNNITNGHENNALPKLNLTPWKSVTAFSMQQQQQQQQQQQTTSDRKLSFDKRHHSDGKKRMLFSEEDEIIEMKDIQIQNEFKLQMQPFEKNSSQSHHNLSHLQQLPNAPSHMYSQYQTTQVLSHFNSTFLRGANNDEGGGGNNAISCGGGGDPRNKGYEFSANPFVMSQYNEFSRDFQEYKLFGLESLLRNDSSMLIRVLSGDLNKEKVDFVQEDMNTSLYLSQNKYRAIILKFETIAGYDQESLHAINRLCQAIRAKSLPFLIIGLPEAIAEDLFDIDENLFQAHAVILGLNQ